MRFKISGLLMPILGFGAEHRTEPMGQSEFVDRVGPLITWAIDTIGIERCMFGSNFPMDKVSITYATLVSGYDELLRNRSEAEKRSFYADNRARVLPDRELSDVPDGALSATLECFPPIPSSRDLND